MAAWCLFVQSEALTPWSSLLHQNLQYFTTPTQHALPVPFSVHPYVLPHVYFQPELSSRLRSLTHAQHASLNLHYVSSAPLWKEALSFLDIHPMSRVSPPLLWLPSAMSQHRRLFWDFLSASPPLTHHCWLTSNCLIQVILWASAFWTQTRYVIKMCHNRCVDTSMPRTFL